MSGMPGGHAADAVVAKIALAVLGLVGDSVAAKAATPIVLRLNMAVPPSIANQFDMAGIVGCGNSRAKISPHRRRAGAILRTRYAP
jgi:hypothetical protein